MVGELDLWRWRWSGVARVVVARVAIARWVKESEGDGGVGEPSSSPCHR